ncbi:MAG: hypothetical protein Kow0090_13340 [Myxococcota bacterium]
MEARRNFFWLVIFLMMVASGCSYVKGYIGEPSDGYGDKVGGVKLSAEEEGLLGRVVSLLADEKYDETILLDGRLTLAAREINNYVAREGGRADLDKFFKYIKRRYGIYEGFVTKSSIPKPFHIRQLKKDDLATLIEDVRRNRANRIGVAILGDGWQNMRYFAVVVARQDFGLSKVSFEIPATSTMLVQGAITTPRKPFVAFVDDGSPTVPPTKVEIDEEKGVWSALLPINPEKDKINIEIRVKSEGWNDQTGALIKLKKEGLGAFKGEEEESSEHNHSKKSDNEPFPKEKDEQLEYLAKRINEFREGLGLSVAPQMEELREPLAKLVAEEIENYRTVDNTLKAVTVPEETMYIVVKSRDESPDVMLKKVFRTPKYKHILTCSHFKGFEVAAKQFLVYPESKEGDKKKESAWILAIIAKMEHK